jgi:hypothetical protein
LKVDELVKCPKIQRRKNYHIGAPTPITPTLGYRQASTPSVANRQLSVLKFEAIKMIESRKGAKIAEDG